MYMHFFLPHHPPFENYIVSYSVAKNNIMQTQQLIKKAFSQQVHLILYGSRKKDGNEIVKIQNEIKYLCIMLIYLLNNFPFELNRKIN